MGQLPAGTGQSKRLATGWQSYRTGWVMTFIATAVLLAIIVGVATVDGLRIASREHTLKSLESNIPGREQVYSGSILAPPTVVTAPQPTREEVFPNSALVVPTVIAVPQPFVEGLTASVRSSKVDDLLRSGPGTEYAAIRKLVPGEQVQLLTEPVEINGQRWQRVRTDDDHRVGWCMIHWLSPVSAGE